MNDHPYITEGHHRWRLRLFHVSSPGGPKVFVEATNATGGLVSFEMQQDHHQSWRILPPAPLWAFEKEEELLLLLLEA